MRFAKSLSGLLLLTLAFAAASSSFGTNIHAGQKRKQKIIISDPPTVSLTASTSRVVLDSECYEKPPDPSCATTSPLVELTANATEVGRPLTYTFTTTGGKLKSDSPNATLDLSRVAPGEYTVTVEVADGDLIAFTSTKVTAMRCSCPYPPSPPPCPTINVSCPSDLVRHGTPVTFTANVSGGDPNAVVTFKWTLSSGTITSGQSTSSITVDTTGLPNSSSVTATVDVGGYDRNCSTTASCTTAVYAIIEHGKIDEYGNIRFNDEKARLDNFIVELQNDPTTQGYVLCYGGRVGYEGEAQRRCGHAKDYISNTCEISADRIVTVDGGYKEELTVELWIVPSGANPPTASPTVDPSEVKTTPAPRPRRRRGRRDDDEE